MIGRTVTREQKRFHDLLCSRIGCIACTLDGLFNTYCSIHHTEGRTKPHAHWLVLPLCGGHHQDDGCGLIAIHPWKRRFEDRYGKQAFLIRLCIARLCRVGAASQIPAAALAAAGITDEEFNEYQRF